MSPRREDPSLERADKILVHGSILHFAYPAVENASKANIVPNIIVLGFTFFISYGAIYCQAICLYYDGYRVNDKKHILRFILLCLNEKRHPSRVDPGIIGCSTNQIFFLRMKHIPDLSPRIHFNLTQCSYTQVHLPFDPRDRVLGQKR